MPQLPPPRKKTLREIAQEAVNEQTTHLAEEGFKDIDRLKRHAITRLKRNGIVGMEQIADAGADLVKALLARGLSK